MTSSSFLALRGILQLPQCNIPQARSQVARQLNSESILFNVAVSVKFHLRRIQVLVLVLVHRPLTFDLTNPMSPSLEVISQSAASLSHHQDVDEHQRHPRPPHLPAGNH
ncbi:unnamed protein product [Pleuronectes platessa]|uniref:Uncharacterized protein n=1 Tax=Pleuronectes platessa TaxID=8262 RepID=A0A9N7Z7G1_PLEPL|nr:unnamed protein product [Pleuronectes platessa]